MREALTRLEQAGVLPGPPRGGFVLHAMTESEIHHIYQSSAAIGRQASRTPAARILASQILAAQILASQILASGILAARSDPALNADLRATIQREQTIASSTVQARFDANRAIHRRFVERVNNRHPLEMLATIRNRAAAFRLFAAIETVGLSRPRATTWRWSMPSRRATGQRRSIPRSDLSRAGSSCR